jgi:hypothetical protein
MKFPFSEERLNKLIHHQKKTPKEKRKQIAVVFDDLLADKGARHSDLIMYAYGLGDTSG